MLPVAMASGDAGWMYLQVALFMNAQVFPPAPKSMTTSSRPNVFDHHGSGFSTITFPEFDAVDVVLGSKK